MSVKIKTFWNSKVFVRGNTYSNKFYATVGRSCYAESSKDEEIFESQRKIDKIYEEA